MARDRHGDYFERDWPWSIVRLEKIAINDVSGSVSVGTYDLGRRFRVLREGEYPPFRWKAARFKVQRLRNGRLRWGEQVDDG